MVSIQYKIDLLDLSRGLIFSQFKGIKLNLKLLHLLYNDRNQFWYLDVTRTIVKIKYEILLEFDAWFCQTCWILIRISQDAFEYCKSIAKLLNLYKLLVI